MEDNKKIRRLTCKNCGAIYNEAVENCSNCGASSNQFVDYSKVKPKTIKELKQWYQFMNLPKPEVTRFFIGENYTKAKAFGIYEKNKGYFVVYKNKADGSRAIRYEGTDEAYAVNELYLKLKEEIKNQKKKNEIPGYTHKDNINGFVSGNALSLVKTKLQSLGLTLFIIFSVIIILIGIVAVIVDAKRNGYYTLDSGTYYYYSNANVWFIYDDYSDDWHTTSKPAEENIWDYKDRDFDASWQGSLATDSADYISEYNEYQEKHSSSSDNSSDDWGSSWDSSDSWDSGSTDWGSDW